MTFSPKRPIYRVYRKLKRHFLRVGPTPTAKLFFFALGIANRMMSRNRPPTEYQRLETMVRKMTYLQRFGTQPLFDVLTEKPVAIDSADHKWPRGTLHDNSMNRNFNLKAYSCFKFKPDFKLLDLGCAGGGLVRSVLDDGYTAVGLEGSDISRKLRSGEWDTCIHHLFTCDLTVPFEIRDRDGKPVLFDVITCWDVLEHIPTEKIPVLLQNVRKHLAPGGLFVGSVDMTPDGDPMTGAVYHLTVKPKDWWMTTFQDQQFVEEKVHPFEVPDYVRGNGTTLKDWDPADGEGCHLVMRVRPAETISAPPGSPA
jgi:SAM-dependent methyltransferase